MIFVECQWRFYASAASSFQEINQTMGVEDLAKINWKLTIAVDLTNVGLTMPSIRLEIAAKLIAILDKLLLLEGLGISIPPPR